MTNHDKSISGPSEGRRHLVKSAGVVGLMTLASRILGMIRDIVSAKQFGTSWQWDSFIFAFMIPNFLRRLVGEGALSSAFIPIYTEILHKEGEAKAFRFANLVATLFGMGLLILIGILELILQAILTCQGLSPRVVLLVSLLRVFFPYLWFISIYAVGMGILNCHRRFFAASLGPVILDLFWIAGVLWAVPLAGVFSEDQLWVLSWVVLASGLAQVGSEFPSLIKIKFRYQALFDFKDEALRKAGRLLLPSLLSFGIVQINLLADQILAMFLDPGANSALWYGTRMMQFPLGIFAIAMGTALLPAISRQTAAGDLAGAQKSMSFALRSVFLIILPCSVGLIVLRDPIIQMLFERGQFDAVSTHRSASVMMYFTFGLFAYSGQKIITSGFYALQDTKTPVKTGIFCLLLNLALNLIFMRTLKESGLALATSIAGIVQFLLLVAIFKRKVPSFPLGEIAQSFFRILLASLAMGIFCVMCYRAVSSWWLTAGTVALIVRVLGSMGLSVAVYILFCFLFRVQEAKEALAWILTKRVR